MATLFLIGTPIGNLQDITLRALETLKSVDSVLCEDTRVTKKLLSHYGIRVSVISYHQHTSFAKTEYVFELLNQGKNLALVTDAGTPGISDPGNELVRYLVEKKSEIMIVPIPGVSALTAAASVSGFPMDKFLFLGYPPRKKGRKRFFELVIQSEFPVVIYESPYRIVKTLKELQALRSTERVVVCRELTKKFETISRGSIDEVLKTIEKGIIKGEFTIIISKR